MMKRLGLALAAAMLVVAPARAEDTVKIGFIAPSTGQFAQIGAMMIAGAKYFLAENGTSVAG
jgi:branched-chain amino acid transport system substrate-binding protein